MTNIRFKVAIWKIGIENFIVLLAPMIWFQIDRNIGCLTHLDCLPDIDIAPETTKDVFSKPIS
jgi:hypothetical protein